jgi:uncharacterized LabA/DUF88 family protein
VAHQDRLNIAVFIDFDNIEIGVKTTLGEHFDVGTILDAIKERGEVVTKIAYADWTRAGEYSRNLTQHAIRLVQRNLTPGGDKNGADINLALDALEMAFTHPHINAYVIVGGDSDFLSLVEKLKQYDKKVFVVGGRAFTSMILQRNCHEFIAYENLVRRPVRGGRPQVQQSTSPIAQAFPIVRRALKILADREVSPQTGLLKSTLLQLDSTFSERNYGASSFLDFAEKLAKEGIVTLKHAGRSVMVELNPSAADDETGSAQPSVAQGFSPASSPTSQVAQGFSPASSPTSQVAQGFSPATTFSPAPPPGNGSQSTAPKATESAAAGIARAVKILGEARNARWPMYLRNVKQILRQAEGGFDERRYGFGGLMDLLKALQRESYVRIERDRRGGLRVFQGQALQRYTPSSAIEGLPLVDPALEAAEFLEASPVESQPGEPVAMQEPAITEQPEAEPMPVDTTAELLGRKTRKPRAQRPPRAAAAATRRTSGKKAAPRRTRSRKSSESTDDSQS